MKRTHKNQHKTSENAVDKERRVTTYISNETNENNLIKIQIKLVNRFLTSPKELTIRIPFLS